MLFSFSLFHTGSHCLHYDFKWHSFDVEFSFHFIGTFNFEWARLYTIQYFCWDIYIFLFVVKCIEIGRFHIYFMHIFCVQLNFTFSMHVITAHRWFNFWCYDKSIFIFLLLLLSWFTFWPAAAWLLRMWVYSNFLLLFFFETIENKSLTSPSAYRSLCVRYVPWYVNFYTFS